MLNRVPNDSDIQEAHERIAAYVHRTPVMISTSINEMAGCHIYFKGENFQKVGAFKMRGGINASLQIPEEKRQNGLATHSSGNHAQAVAKSAQLLGIPAYIVMPENAPQIKRKATEGYGAHVCCCAATIESRQATLEEVVQKTGAHFIHPFDNYDVICGAATASKEMIEHGPLLDFMLAPVGGGGLISGTCLSNHYFASHTKVIGAEPEIVDDAYRSLNTGILQTNNSIDTVADGLRTNLSEKTFGIIQKHIFGIVTVSEAEIISAMRLIWERMKIIVEPSCAVPLAAVLKEKKLFANAKVGIILTGGNVDVESLPF